MRFEKPLDQFRFNKIEQELERDKIQVISCAVSIAFYVILAFCIYSKFPYIIPSPIHFWVCYIFPIVCCFFIPCIVAYLGSIWFDKLFNHFCKMLLVISLLLHLFVNLINCYFSSYAVMNGFLIIDIPFLSIHLNQVLNQFGLYLISFISCILFPIFVHYSRYQYWGKLKRSQKLYKQMKIAKHYESQLYTLEETVKRDSNNSK